MEPIDCELINRCVSNELVPHCVNLQIADTHTPRDFVKDKKKLSPKELSQRAHIVGRRVFQKEKGTPATENGGDVVPAVLADLAPLAAGVTEDEDFAERISELRLFLQDLATPRMHAVWLHKFRSHMGDRYTEVTCFADFLQVYISSSNSNQMNKDVNFVCNVMWGKGQWAIELEQLVMKMLKLHYTEELCSGKKCLTKRKHGSIKSMFVRMKQTIFCDPIREASLRFKNQVLHQRKLDKPMEGVLAVIKVTKESHGFDGHLGLGEGHPELPEIDEASSAPKEGELLHCYLTRMMQKGTNKTTAELLDGWNSSHAKSRENMLISTDQGSTGSPLTAGIDSIADSATDSATTAFSPSISV